MKTITLLLTASLSAATAATFSFPDAAGAIIPDGSSSGLLRSIAVNLPGEIIAGVEVDVNITAAAQQTAFLGDLYLYLSNGSSLSVLVNRAGRTSGAPAGYADDQPMFVTFGDAAADIHNYRLTLNGSHETPLTGPLTGLWQPDGRAADPATVLDTTPRTAGLDLFNGQTATGTWRLFAADLSTGAVHQLNAWTLRFDTIPEPGTGLMTLGVMFIAAARRRRTA